MYYTYRGLGQAPLQCSVTWDEPTQNGVGMRQVGQPSRVRIRITGLRPSATFIIFNRHEGGGIVQRSQLQADASGVFEVYDTTIVGPEYARGNYTTIIEADGKSFSCGQFQITAAAAYQPPAITAPDYTPSLPPSGTGIRTTYAPPVTGAPAPIFVSTPGGPVLTDYGPAEKAGEPEVAEAGIGGVGLLLAAGIAAFFLFGRKGR